MNAPIIIILALFLFRNNATKQVVITCNWYLFFAVCDYKCYSVSCRWNTLMKILCFLSAGSICCSTAILPVPSWLIHSQQNTGGHHRQALYSSVKGDLNRALVLLGLVLHMLVIFTTFCSVVFVLWFGCIYIWFASTSHVIGWVFCTSQVIGWVILHQPSDWLGFFAPVKWLVGFFFAPVKWLVGFFLHQSSDWLGFFCTSQVIGWVFLHQSSDWLGRSFPKWCIMCRVGR